MSSKLPDFFRIALNPSRQMSGIVLQITPQPHTVMFAIYYSLIIILFDAVNPGLLTASKRQPESTQMHSVCSRTLHWNALDVF